MKNKNKFYFVSGIISLLLIWFLISCFDKSGFILPSPFDVGKELVKKIITIDFWRHAFFTTERVMLGFLISCIPAFVCGLWWGLKPCAYCFFLPVMTAVKSIPVVSVVLLFVFWFGTDLVPVITCAIMTFPQVASSVYSSVKNYPKDYLLMAKSFRLEKFNMIKYMYVPHAKNSFIASSGTALSQSWKIVCAAEVLSLPKNGLGSSLFFAKTNVEIASMFADTIAVVLLCAVFDFVFSKIAKAFKGNK